MLQFNVPTEAYLKERFQHFIRPIQDRFQIDIVGYNGSSEHINNARHQMYLQVKKLFSCLQVSTVPDMNNGHSWQNEKSKLSYTLDRCLILRDSTNNPVGAIYFRINLLLKRCLIAQIGVDENHRFHGYGKILWHCAVFQAILFGCTYISANPSTEATHFFKKLGHSLIHLINDEIVEWIAFLDLNNDEKKQMYIQNVATVAENYNMEQHLTKTHNHLQFLSEEKLLEQFGFLIESDPNCVAFAFTSKEVKMEKAKKALTSMAKQTIFSSPHAIQKVIGFEEADSTLAATSRSSTI